MNVVVTRDIYVRGKNWQAEQKIIWFSPSKQWRGDEEGGGGAGGLNYLVNRFLLDGKADIMLIIFTYYAIVNT